MKQQNCYIQWQHNTSNSLDEKVAEITKHWRDRYELGSAVILTDAPAMALKNVTRQWRKLTRQLQTTRESKQSAQDILEVTRTISRMQRVKFSVKNPNEDPDATLYLLRPSEVTSLPTNCYTLYSLNSEVDPKLLEKLASDALVVLYQTKQPNLTHVKEKSSLEDRVLIEEEQLVSWLDQHNITLANPSIDLEAANEALDTLLGSTKLQSDFLHKSGNYMHMLSLAQPIKLSEERTARLEALKAIERHVRVLSPSFLSDHIVNSGSDDSFLLRDRNVKQVLAVANLHTFIIQQYQAGRDHLAEAVERRAGFVRV